MQKPKKEGQGSVFDASGYTPTTNHHSTYQAGFLDDLAGILNGLLIPKNKNAGDYPASLFHMKHFCNC